MASEERIRRALLTGLTVLALAVGGWWWRSAMPDLGPVGSGPGSGSADPAPFTPESDPFADRAARVRVVDPATGDVSSGGRPGLAVVEREPARSDLLWHDGSHLRAGAGVERQTSSAPGARHLLTVACRGPGPLTVSWSGAADDGAQLLVDCGGPAVFQPLVATGGPVVVRFTAGERQLDLDAGLAGLY
ncbi:hypothetical protein [Micromonospora sp. NBS 11-29]|uniref:hypothetical protein n=1 Tax=Micromonospora sp. NBS 11-29 TaxID=1960879 RepID=UPI000B78D259|nr:hypothetical protein [Micromonospora sp. NBS 11-29]